MPTKPRRIRERLWRLSGAGLPNLRPGEEVILSLGGWISGGSSGGSGRVVLTTQRLINVGQVVEPYWPRRSASERILTIELPEVVEVGAAPRKRSRWVSWKSKFTLRLVLRGGEQVTVVTGGARQLRTELAKLISNLNGPGAFGG